MNLSFHSDASEYEIAKDANGNVILNDDGQPLRVKTNSRTKDGPRKLR